MPAPQRRFAQATPAVNGIPDGVETVIATTPAVSTSFPGCAFLIEFNVAYLLGDAATSARFLIRQDGIGGLGAVPEWNFGTFDALTLDGFIAASAVDQRAVDAANVVWVLTVTPVGDIVSVAGGTASVTVDVGGQPSVFTD